MASDCVLVYDDASVISASNMDTIVYLIDQFAFDEYNGTIGGLATWRHHNLLCPWRRLTNRGSLAVLRLRLSALVALGSGELLMLLRLRRCDCDNFIAVVAVVGAAAAVSVVVVVVVAEPVTIGSAIRQRCLVGLGRRRRWRRLCETLAPRHICPDFLFVISCLLRLLLLLFRFVLERKRALA